MLKYKSRDDYFDITEESTLDNVVVVHIFSTPIFGIDNFYTRSTYNLQGHLIQYENALGDFIDYRDNPVKVLTPPRILKDI